MTNWIKKQFLPDWQHVLKTAWSIKFILLAGVLTGAEAILPKLVAYFPGHLYDLLKFGVIAAAFISRLLAQKLPVNVEK